MRFRLAMALTVATLLSGCEYFLDGGEFGLSGSSTTTETAPLTEPELLVDGL